MLMRASTLSIAHETAGAARTRHSLRPLIDEGHVMAKTRAHSCRENANTYPTAVIPGRALLARARNPYSRWWLWIPGLRQAAHPGMTREERCSCRRLACGF